MSIDNGLLNNNIIFLGNESGTSPVLRLSTSSQTTQLLSLNTPRKRKLKLEVKELRNRCQ